MWWEVLVVQGLVALGLLLANLDRLRLTGRLRHNVVVQQAIVKELPEGIAQRELQEHINRQVRLMVVEQEPATAAERIDTRWSLAYLGLGFVLPWAMLEGGFGYDAAWYLVLTGLGSLGLIGAGLHLNMKTGRARNHRKWAGRTAVDLGVPRDPGSPASGE